MPLLNKQTVGLTQDQLQQAVPSPRQFTESPSSFSPAVTRMCSGHLPRQPIDLSLLHQMWDTEVGRLDLCPCFHILFGVKEKSKWKMAFS